MRFELDITYEDFVEAYVALTKRSGSVSRHFMLGFGAITAGFAVLAMFDHRFAADTPQCLALVGVVIGSMGLTPSPTKKYWKANERAYGPSRIDISESGITEESPEISVVYRWSAFCGLSETKRLFLLHRSKAFALIIPKRLVGGERDVESFRTFVSAHVLTPVHGFPVEPLNQARSKTDD